MMQKKLVILCGAAGTGKTTVQQYLIQHHHFAKVITHTTRAPRAGEVDGRDYYFETPASLTKLHLLEHVEYDHHLYGSSREGLERAWQQSPRAVAVLDTAGALTYLRAFPDQVEIIYLTVSDQGVLGRRLTGRGDDPAAVQSRLKSAEFQRDLTLPVDLQGHAKVVVNDDWQATKRRLDEIVAELTE